MTAELVDLHPELTCLDVVKSLRRIADDIEAGRIEAPTIATLVLAYDNQRRDRTGFALDYGWTTYALGETATVLTARGLLLSAANSFNGPVGPGAKGGA